MRFCGISLDTNASRWIKQWFHIALVTSSNFLITLLYFPVMFAVPSLVIPLQFFSLSYSDQQCTFPILWKYLIHLGMRLSLNNTKNPPWSHLATCISHRLEVLCSFQYQCFHQAELQSLFLTVSVVAWPLNARQLYKFEELLCYR